MAVGYHALTASTDRGKPEFSVPGMTLTDGLQKRDVSDMLDVLFIKDTPFLDRVTWGPESGGLEIEWITENLGPGYMVAAAKATAVTSITFNTIDGMTTVFSSYGKSIATAAEVAGAFFSAQVKGKVTVAELASSIGMAAPAAKSVGIGFRELLASMSALTTAGLPIEQATTAIRASIMALIKPGKEARSTLTKMGIIFGAERMEAEGLTKTLISLAEAHKKYGTDAIGVALPNVRAFTGVLALGTEKIKLIDVMLRKMHSDIKTGDGLQRAYNDKLKGMLQRFKMLRGELSVTSKKFAEHLAPAINKTLNVLSMLLRKFSSMSVANKKILIAITLLVAALPPLIALVAALALAWGALTWPIVATAAGIMAVVVALTLAIRKFQQLIKLMKESKIGMMLGGKLKGLFDGTVISRVKEKIGGLIGIEVNDPGGNIKRVTTQSDNPNVSLGPVMADR